MQLKISYTTYNTQKKLSSALVSRIVKLKAANHLVLFKTNKNKKKYKI